MFTEAKTVLNCLQIQLPDYVANQCLISVGIDYLLTMDPKESYFTLMATFTVIRIDQSHCNDPCFIFADESSRFSHVILCSLLHLSRFAQEKNVICS